MSRSESGAGDGRRGQGARRDRSALAQLAADPGLCATCVHLQLVGSKRSVFVRCGRSDEDDRFLRYPPLPVFRCAGYEAESETDPEAD